MMTPVELENRTNVDARLRTIMKIDAKIAKMQRERTQEEEALRAAQLLVAKTPSEQACGRVQWLDESLAFMLMPAHASWKHGCYTERGIGDNPAILFRGRPEDIGALAHNMDIHQLTYTRGVNFINNVKPHKTQAVIVSATTVYVITSR